MARVRMFLTVALLGVLCAVPARAAIQLVPVASGFSSPIFVGHAGDQTYRLFVVEQAGFIYVLQPGSSTPTLFIDIHDKVLSGGERGLLGLAFHPAYRSNRRFYVFYTRKDDGAVVIAEYKASASNPNVADATERPLLAIPHPTFGNHNGGMLAFGPDGYLYIGVGDGGSGNDPSNNAQNLNTLLGKILRINVDSAGSIPPYTSPPGNPFAGSTPGLDEIYAVGLRNPWRFSFDRQTGQLWVGDVGQGAFEEVDTPVLAGANLGWRVYEGGQCTGIDPGLCNPSQFIPPIFAYGHSGGRCSITGGYVYRGVTGAVPMGTYVYADYCTGEIFTWNGVSQELLLDTPSNIASFGEDQTGELYVVTLGGAISRIAPPAPVCQYTLSPSSASFNASGGPGVFSVTTQRGCTYSASTASPWIHLAGGDNGRDNAIRSRFDLTFTVDANSGQTDRAGTIIVSGQTFVVQQDGASGTAIARPGPSLSREPPRRER